ncbi:thiamine pyrophosphate-binding protein [Streptomyces sp. ISL-99]|uniref:thiamine pyrophosphate-binding protein n=1 Tax=Streptomyces sp. ISL-99 TaxID=2819193 RepID=UPI001BED22B2|nr:thiamine pyrophosphate-binding protein [Streptomyces sp. ISL-99]MBT2525718.1 thiamine pyrophosphate-binding protein [Streptomyces sp. ISL-99]
MRLADALVTVLRDLDTRYVFGVSGANIEHVHDAIERLGHGRLTSVLAKREDGAAFMADARARVHRTLGVCCSTSGGGMMNLVAGLAESHAESVPVLALVGQPPTALDGHGSFQDSSGTGRTVDALPMLRSVTKKTVRLTESDGFWDRLRDAITTSLSGRKGPVALLLPRDSYELDVGERPFDWPTDISAFIDPEPVDVEAVSALFERLRNASAPVLLLGHGVRRSCDPEAVRVFAERARIPVVTTMGARGEFPNDSPLYLGVVGEGGHPSAAAYVEKSDFVLAVGTGLALMTRRALPGWDASKAGAVNIDPGELERSSLADILVRGDAGRVFQLLERLRSADPFTAPPVTGYELTRFLPRPAPPVPGRTGTAGGDALVQSEAVQMVQEYLPHAGHLLYDAGNCSVASMHYGSVPPGSTSTIALGMGGMGYSIAAAIGAQLGSRPGTRTVVFCGDGAFLMSGLEIHTAVELGLPILYVVFNNGMHGMCATRQQKFFDSRITTVDYTPVDAHMVARGLGTGDRLWVASAGTPGELARRLDEYQLNCHLPGVLELRLPVEEVPPFASFLPADEPTVSVPRPRQPVVSYEMTGSAI